MTAPPADPSCTFQVAAVLAVPVTVALNETVPLLVTDVVCGVMEIMTVGAGVTRIVESEDTVRSATALAST